MVVRRTWVLLGLAGAAAVAAVVWLARPSPPQTAEERIRAALLQAARSAEERKVGEVAELLSGRFRGGAGGEGGLGRDDARRLLALELLRGQWVSVSLPSIEIAVDASQARARARVDALLSRAADRGKGLQALLPGEASVHRFALELEVEPDGRWRVVGATWRPVDLAEALEGPGKPGW